MDKTKYNDDWHGRVQNVEEQLTDHIKQTNREITEVRNRLVLIKSEMDHLKGTVTGSQTACSDYFRLLSAQIDHVCSEVFRPTLANRIRWFISDMLNMLNLNKSL